MLDVFVSILVTSKVEVVGLRAARRSENGCSKLEKLCRKGRKYAFHKF